ncbi:MAG: polysaccharide biosynthesis protein [Alphaproteobacteria bacterium]
MKIFRNPKTILAILHDTLAAAAAFYFALYMRVGEHIFSYYPQELLIFGGGLFTLICFVVFWFSGLYRGIWRYASLNDLFSILRAVTFAVLIFLPTLFFLTRLEDYPRSVLVITWFVLIFALGGSRLLYRMSKDRSVSFLRKTPKTAIPVLLVGADNRAEIFIREMMRHPSSSYQVLGIIDRGEEQVGRNIHGISVLGDLDDIEVAIERLSKKNKRPQRILIALDDFIGEELRTLLNTSEKLSIPVSRLPKATDFNDRFDTAVPLRPIPVEDLLGRAQKPLDKSRMHAFVSGKKVLITGAGGTIGSELVRQVTGLSPQSICLLDHSEFALYKIDQECSEEYAETPVTNKLADVRDKKRIDAVFKEFKPDIVFHAAALKHVPMLENHRAEGVLTNAIGTRNVADAAKKNKAETFVMISTDKAINPTSFMGATKRLAELYCQSLTGSETQFVTVRFGNVLGSNGSVVPLFSRQIANGGPITVTHPDINRYFMTIREAVGLVIQASASHKKEDSGKVYVLDMGEPVKIVDLAKQMIRLAGLQPDIDIKINFVGLRPGEKLYEELFYDAENFSKTSHQGIFLAAPRKTDHKTLIEKIKELEKTAQNQDHDACFSQLKMLVPSYKNDKK